VHPLRPSPAAACEGFLHRQVELVAPDLILSVGRVSAHNLLHTDAAVGRLRGREHRFQPGDIPLIVTYHPAYLLRRPEEKAKAWQDLQVAHRLLRSAP
jgi:uracil-DNA glycosylase family 4